MNRSILKHRIKKYRWLFLFLVPAVVFALLFSYLPMVGILVGFKDNLNLIRYSPLEAFAKADWTLEHFQRIFSSSEFLHILGNTLIISLMKIFLLFPMPIILAIMVTELTNRIFSKAVQSIVYLPPFLSWGVITGIFMNFMGATGPLNQALIKLGLMDASNPVYWFGTDSIFRWLVVFISGWKEIGYSSIVYISAIMAIDSQLYEAAKIDGAGKFRQIWSVTLPGILTTIVTLLIIRIGYLMDAGFEQIYTMLSANTRPSGEIIGTYVYRISLGENAGDYGFSTAVGLFNGLVALILILIGNFTSKRLTGAGIW